MAATGSTALPRKLSKRCRNSFDAGFDVDDSGVADDSGAGVEEGV